MVLAEAGRAIFGTTINQVGACVKVQVRRILIGIIGLILLGLSWGADAQQRNLAVPSRSNSYNSKNETVVQGTVLSYSETTGRAPIGARVTVQTSTGPLEVQVGSASYLHANNLSFAPGDFVRFVGANATEKQGTVLLARTVQKGNQTVNLRSPQGFPMVNRVTLSDEQRAAAAQQARPR